jgi:uncharacterized protein YgbK (DUF1537 family)
MSDPHPTADRLLAGLPPEWPEDLLATIARRVARSGRKVVVLDDDPTGTQTVRDVAVLTAWPVDALAAELRNPAPCFYLLTNSRSMDEARAVEVAREIGGRLREASASTGVAFEVVSRSDSTLRGHFPAEVDALLDAAGLPPLPCLVVPFFLEGERYTVGDIHYVGEGGRLVPAADTPYARDEAFGYRNSDLRLWIAEKTRGRVSPERIASLSIADIRGGGPERAAERLSALGPGDHCVVNAASYRDLEVVVAGLLSAEAAGRRFVCRTAASFVRVRAGIPPGALLQAEDMTFPGTRGGLFVVGSHVPKSSEQLAALRDCRGVLGVELAVENLLREDRRAREIRRAADAVNRELAAGGDVALFTSRRLVGAGDAAASLEIGRKVSDGLVAVVRDLRSRPRYLVAKGGITSSDVATRGLGVRRAVVLGQVLPGVPVWRLGEEARYPGMAYVVFPGNVGGASALADIRERLTRSAPGPP